MKVHLLTVVVGACCLFQMISSEVISCPPGSQEYFAHPTECNKFIQCMDEKAVILSCPTNFFWNALDLKCDWRFNVVCPGDEVEDTTVSVEPPTRPYEPITNDVEIVRECDAYDGRDILHPLNCSLYLSCNALGSITMTCEDGLYFNENENKCDDPANVDCQWATTEDPDTTTEDPDTTTDDPNTTTDDPNTTTEDSTTPCPTTTTTPCPTTTTTPCPITTTTPCPTTTTTPCPTTTTTPCPTTTTTPCPTTTTTPCPTTTTTPCPTTTTTPCPTTTTTPCPTTTTTPCPTTTTTPCPTTTTTPCPTTTTTPCPTTTTTPCPTTTTTPCPTTTTTPCPTTTTPCPCQTSTPCPCQTSTPCPCQTSTPCPLENPPTPNGPSLTTLKPTPTIQSSITNNVPAASHCDGICASGADYIPSPTDCSKFIRCVYCVAHVMNCPRGLLWSKEKNVCDWSYNVKC